MKLEEHPFIQAISEERRREILDEIELLELHQGDVIFEANSAPDALFLLLSGDVDFTQERLDGSRKTVSQSKEGKFFGEVGVFTKEPRALSAVAGRSCCVARVSERTVNRIMEEAEPMRKILESVIHHLSSTTEQYMDEVMRTEKLTLVGTMVSSLLHDFKNPFSMISLGSNRIRQRYKEDPKTAKICENIESQIRHMVNMANDLAAFAHGDSQIEVAEVEVDHLFEQFRELNSPFFKDESIHLTMQGNGTHLRGDANKLLRVLQNLISNAIEALHSVNIHGWVQVTAEESDRAVTLTIADNGPGIPQSIRKSFFEPFVTCDKNEGTGLGTAIAKSIIDAHQGEIDFETSAEGTILKIYLPRVKTNAAAPSPASVR